MATVGTLVAYINADISNYQRNLNNAVKTMETSAAKMKQVGTTLTASVTLPLAAVGGAALKMAMDAAESENLFEVSMGNMASSARQWSEELRKELGLNAYEVRKNVATFNVMLGSMGLTEQAAFDMSKGMTQLSYDMASFYNLKPEEAFMKLQAGISGEIEPLKRLGIIVNETTTKTWALNNGLIKQGEQLSEAGKVMARYGAIMEATQKAQGDMARTLDSPVNQLRILQEQVKQTAIDFGMALIPAFQDALKAAQPILQKVKEFVAWFTALNPEMQQNIIKWTVLIMLLGPALGLFGQLTSIVNILGGGLLKVVGGLGQMILSLGGVTTGATAATGATAGLTAALGPFLLGGAVILGLGVIAKLWLDIAKNIRIANASINEINTVDELRKKIKMLNEDLTQVNSALNSSLGFNLDNPKSVERAKKQRAELEATRARIGKELSDAEEKIKLLSGGGASPSVDVDKIVNDIQSSINNVMASFKGLGGSGSGVDIKKITVDLEDSLRAIDETAKALEGTMQSLGLEEEITAKKASVVADAIANLISEGYKASDPVIQALIKKLGDYNEEYQAIIDKNAELDRQIEDALVDQTDALNRAGDAQTDYFIQQREAQQQQYDAVRASLEQQVGAIDDYNQSILDSTKRFWEDFWDARYNGDIDRFVELLQNEEILFEEHLEAKREMLDLYYEVWKESHFNAVRAMTETMDGLYGGLESFFTDIISGTKSIGDAWEALKNTMIRVIAQIIAKWIAAKITEWIMSKTMMATTTAANTAAASSTAMAWAPAAAMASLASFGANSAPAMAGIASTYALSTALSAIPMLAEGGITTGETLAVIGEGRYQEAVLPLDRKVFEDMGLVEPRQAPTVHQHNHTWYANDGKSTQFWLENGGGDQIERFMRNRVGEFASVEG